MNHQHVACRSQWPLVFWVANLLILVQGCVWLYGSGQSYSVVRGIELDWHWPFQDPGPAPEMTSEFAKLKSIGKVGLGTSATTLVVILATLVIGPGRYRALRSWLSAMTLFCVWLGLLVGWQQLHWLGQCHRAQSYLPGFQPIAQELAKNWPDGDGASPSLGPFMAYPIREPRTLMLMGPREIPGTPIKFVAVEKTDDGAIRFQLDPNEPGAWLEYRPDDSVPTSFLSGLAASYELDRYRRLQTNWYLVRYRYYSPGGRVVPADRLAEPHATF